MKEQKVGLTTKNWILSILGILLLLCVIVLPPVFRIFFEEEEVLPEPDLGEPIVTTICSKDGLENVDYVDGEILTFEHQNLKVKQFTKKTNRIYNDPLVYQQNKQSYGVLVTAFSIITGYDYSATPNDDMSSINIIESYDLNNFKDTTVVIPGDTESTSISSSYQLDSSITTIKEELVANGYVCLENN